MFSQTSTRFSRTRERAMKRFMVTIAVAAAVAALGTPIGNCFAGNRGGGQSSGGHHSNGNHSNGNTGTQMATEAASSRGTREETAVSTAAICSRIRRRGIPPCRTTHRGNRRASRIRRTSPTLRRTSIRRSSRRTAASLPITATEAVTLQAAGITAVTAARTRREAAGSTRREVTGIIPATTTGRPIRATAVTVGRAATAAYGGYGGNGGYGGYGVPFFKR